MTNIPGEVEQPYLTPAEEHQMLQDFFDSVSFDKPFDKLPIHDDIEYDEDD